MLFNTNESNTAKEAYTKLYSKLVPPSGNCETLEGELIRAISNIFWEYNEFGILSNHTGACNFIRKYLIMDSETKQDLEDIYNFVKAGYIPGVSITEQLDRLTYKITRFVSAKNEDKYVYGHYDFNLYQEENYQEDDIELDELDTDYTEPNEPLFYIQLNSQSLNDNLDGNLEVSGRVYQKTNDRSISATCFIDDMGTPIWFKNNCMYPIFKNEDIDIDAKYLFIYPSPNINIANQIYLSGLYFVDDLNRIWYKEADTNWYYAEQHIEKIITE